MLVSMIGDISVEGNYDPLERAAGHICFDRGGYHGDVTVVFQSTVAAIATAGGKANGLVCEGVGVCRGLGD